MADKLNEQNLKAELGKILDPDLGKALEEYEGIEKVVVKDGVVQVYGKIVGPLQWVYKELKDNILKRLEELAPDYKYEIFMDEKLPEQAPRDILKNVKHIIAVASGKGGVGKSAMASNIAAALAKKGAKTGILDGDVYGPSQPTMYGLAGQQMGAEKRPDGKTVAIPLEKHGIKVASMGFLMEKNQAAIIRGPMLAGYFAMLFEQVEWGELDFLIFDLPPGTGDIQLTLTQKIPLTGSVVVTTPQEIALADVRRSIAMFEKVNVDVLGIIENMSYFTPPELPDKKYYIFGKGGGRMVSEESKVELLGEVPLDEQMRAGNDSGTPVVLDPKFKVQGEILEQVAANMVKQVRIKNFNSLQDTPVDIKL